MAGLLSFLSVHPLIVAFLVLNVGFGIWGYVRYRGGGFMDYVLGGGSLGRVVLLMTLLGTFLGGGSLVLSDLFFANGLIQGIDSIGFLVSFVLIGRFVAPCLVHFEKEVTMGDIMGRLYGRGVRVATGVLGSLVGVLIVVSEMMMIGRMSVYLLGLDSWFGVVCFGMVVVLYSLCGGMRVVSYTDVFQLVLGLLVFGWVTGSLLQRLGGVGLLFEGLWGFYGDKLELFGSGGFWFHLKSANFWALSCTLILTLPVVQRMLVTRDELKVRSMWYSSVVLYGLVCVMMGLLGLGALLGDEELGLSGGSGGLLFVLVRSLFGGWMLDMVFIGFLGVLFSTIDSYLHAIGTSLVHDVLEPLGVSFGVGEGYFGVKRLYVRVCIGLVGLLCIVMSVVLGDVSGVLLRCAVVVSGLLVTPFVMGIQGYKTDRLSFFVFCGVYGVVLGLFFVLGFDLYDCFSLGVLLGTVGYVVSHVVLNGGVVSVERHRDISLERLWVPTFGGLWSWLLGWLGGVVNLARLARGEVLESRAVQPLGVSILVFSWYVVQSIVVGDVLGGRYYGVLSVVYLVGMVLCCGLLLGGVWPVFLEPYFALYWFLTLCYCLPLGGVVMFLYEHGGMGSYVFFVGSFVWLGFLVSSRVYGLLSVVGLCVGHMVFYVLEGGFPEDLWFSGVYWGGFVTVLLLMLGVVFFLSMLESHVSDRLYMTKAFAQALPHEIRQPLTDITFVEYASSVVTESLKPIKGSDGEAGFFLPVEMKKLMDESSAKIHASIEEVRGEFSRFQRVLDRDVNMEDQEVVSMCGLIGDALKTLPRRYTESLKVRLVCESDFEGRVVRSFFGNILFNLLKNAKKHGGASEVEIRVDGLSRSVYVRDNGVGMSSEVLSRVFDLRFTTGGDTSRGVGLALVKFILSASRVGISCRSVEGVSGSFTEFAMRFPRV